METNIVYKTQFWIIFSWRVRYGYVSWCKRRRGRRWCYKYPRALAGLSVSHSANNVVFYLYNFSLMPKVTRQEKNTPGWNPPILCYRMTTSDWASLDILVVGQKICQTNLYPTGKIQETLLWGMVGVRFQCLWSESQRFLLTLITPKYPHIPHIMLWLTHNIRLSHQT